MAITISGSGITSANIADGTITTDDILASDVVSLKSGRKNLIINGGFDVWQRGTSLVAGSSYLADRWVNTVSETQSRQAFTVGQTVVTGNPTYFHRGSGGASQWYQLMHRIEDVKGLSGKEVTLSYWMKANVSFTNYPFRDQNFGTGGSTTVSAGLAPHPVTTSWVKYTQTFTMPSISGKTIGANSYSSFSIHRANTLNIIVDTAQVQLELGSVATDFEHRSYGEELALCQRYYQKFKGLGTGTERIAAGMAWSSVNTANHHVNYVVKMRTSPTMTNSGGTIYSPNLGSKAATFTLNTSGSPTQGGSLNSASSTGLVSGDVWYASSPVDTGYFAFDAEL